MLTRPTVQLGELADFVMGQAPPGDQCNTEGNGSIFVKAGEFGSQYPEVREWTTKPLKLAWSGDVLVCVVGATAGKVNRAIDCAIGRSVAAVRPNADKLDSGYLFHFLSSETLFLRQQSQGLAQGVITRDMLGDLVVPLPSLAEQRRIAAILDEADALRAKRRAALAQLDEMARAIFVEMFGTPSAPKSQFTTRPFSSVCQTRLGKMLDQKRQTGEFKRRYLRNANVRWFNFDLSDLLEMDFSPTDQETYRLLPGDILICEGGEPGRAAIWRGQLDNCFYQKALHRARPDPTLAVPEYIVWVLWFLAHGNGLKDHVTVATIAHLTKEKLDTLRIPVPPLSLQRDFAKRLAMLDEARTAAISSSVVLDSLFASLQHRAFRGEL